jgi:transcriptional regulator with XRE-family HTH domain
MIPHPENPGLRLRMLRSRTSKTQKAFSDHCQKLGLSITRNMIANWETSRSDIPAQMIPLLTYALEVEVTDLLPDLRKPAAPLSATNKQADSNNKPANKKGSVAGWFSLNNLFFKKVLAPAFAWFHVFRLPPRKNPTTKKPIVAPARHYRRRITVLCM